MAADPWQLRRLLPPQLLLGPRALGRRDASLQGRCGERAELLPGRMLLLLERGEGVGEELLDEVLLFFLEVFRSKKGGKKRKGK